MKRFLYTLFLLLLLHISISQVFGVEISEMENIIKKYLMEYYRCDDIRIEDLRFHNGKRINPEDISSVKVVKSISDTAVINIKTKDGRSQEATLKLRLLERVVVAKRPLKKGHMVQYTDVDTVLVDLAKVPPGAFKNPEDVLGMYITRSVLSGVILTDSMLRNTEIVKKGKRIWLVAESPGFRISVLGELKNDARIGETARAINLQTRKFVKGILIDENTMMVEF